MERDSGLRDSAYLNAVTAVGLVVGELSVKHPARVLCKVPPEVVPNADEPEEATMHQVLWKLGDEPINADKKLLANQTIPTLK